MYKKKKESQRGKGRSIRKKTNIRKEEKLDLVKISRKDDRGKTSMG